MKMWRLVPLMFPIAILSGRGPTAHGQGLSFSDELQVNIVTAGDQHLPSVESRSALRTLLPKAPRKTRQARQQAQAATEIKAAFADGQRLQEQRKWPEAILAVQRAESLIASSGTGDDLQRRVQNRLTDLNMVTRVEDIRAAR